MPTEQRGKASREILVFRDLSLRELIDEVRENAETLEALPPHVEARVVLLD